MLKKLLFCIVVIASLNGFAQLQVAGMYYEMGMEQEQLSCYIEFINNSDDYYIEISSQETDDIIYVVILSYGKYKIEDGLIVLMDALHEYQMEMALAEDTLLMQKGFEFMKGKSFVRQGTSYGTDIPGGVNENLNKANIQEERNRYNMQNKELHELTYGKYKGIDWDCDLAINENHTYVYEFRECQISKGTWERKGNILTLHDSSLDCDSYLMVGENDKVISKLLVGDNGGRIFKKVQTTTAPTKSGGFGCSRRK